VTTFATKFGFNIDINRYFCMNIRMRLVALILILIAPTWAAADNYLCISDKTVGFTKRDDGKGGFWDEGSFSSGTKFTFSTEKAELSAFGVGTIIGNCDVTRRSIFCQNQTVNFNLNRKNLKFMLVKSTYGYVWDGEDDTPHMAIGTCSKF
jgi:hypothetical protein